MFRKPFTRGTSVLAALVFVAILGVVAYGVGAISPQQNIGGQTAATLNSSQAAASSVAADVKKIKEQNDKKCLEAKNAAKSNAGISPSKPQSFNKGKDTVESGNCIGAVYVKGDVNDLASYKCVGLKTKIYMDKSSTGQIISHPDTGAEAGKGVEAGKCETTFCDASGVNCGASKLVSGAEGVQKWAAGNPELMKDLPAETQKAIVGMSPLDAQTQEAFRNAFSGQTKDDQAQIDSNKKTIDSLQQYIDSCGETDTANCSDLAKKQEEKAALEQKNADLKERVDALTKTQQKDLAPDSSSKDWCSYGGKGTTDCAGNTADRPDLKSTCPTGQISTSEGCKAPGSTIPVPKPDPRKDTTAGAPDTKDPAGSSGGGGIGSALQSILGGLAKALGGAASGSGGAACSSDPNTYAQQQQQYNTALQQYNQQLQQYNYQQQMSQYNGLSAPVPPVAPTQCTQTSSSNTCATAPVQPAASTCANGTWKPVATQQSNGYSCTTSWQCVPGGNTAVTPTAQLSCQPQVADVGMSVAITFGCTNATESVGSGFDTASSTSGSTTTVIAAPPAGATSINYGIQCRNQGLVGNASCSVQISKPSIVLLANPKIVPANSISTIGWVTASMSSCVVSSPNMPEFTTRNASSTVVNGMATTSPITADVTVLLHCVTLGGATKDATTTVQVATSTTP